MSECQGRAWATARRPSPHARHREGMWGGHLRIRAPRVSGDTPEGEDLRLRLESEGAEGRAQEEKAQTPAPGAWGTEPDPRTPARGRASSWGPSGH